MLIKHKLVLLLFRGMGMMYGECVMIVRLQRITLVRSNKLRLFVVLFGFFGRALFLRVRRGFWGLFGATFSLFALLFLFLLFLLHQI